MPNHRNLAPFVAHLRDEHRRLHDALDRTAAALAELRGRSPRVEDLTRASEGLSRLREMLAEHFAEERRGGCLEEAACRRPTLTREEAALERQRPKLLAMLDKLIAETAAPTAGPRGEKLARSFAKVATAIKAHESAEDRLLEAALNGVE